MRLYSSVENRVFGLDLMRAIAILVVLFGHSRYLLKGITDFPWIPLFDGVDLFFVLSGFLIGGILIKSLRKNGLNAHSILSFWRRRWLRTLPNYYLFLVLNVLTALVLVPSVLPSFDLSFFVFAQNLLPFTANHGFFPEAWSLSVEEWFYLLAPLLILSGASASGRTGVTRAVAVAAIFMIAASTWARLAAFDNSSISTHDDYDRHIRKVVLLRLDALGIGLMGALLKSRFHSYWHRCRFLVLPAGAVMIAASIYWVEHASEFGVDRSFSLLNSTILSLGFSCFLPALDGWKTSKGLIGRFITTTSLISYSMYLVHYSLLIVPMRWYIWPDNGYSALLQFVLFWIVTYLLATINYRYFEARIMAFRDKRFSDSQPAAI